MRWSRWLLVASAVLSFTACGGGKNNAKPDAGDTGPKPQCSDGKDNDSDGKIDFPYDPGCFSPNQDDETDDCPNGPTCPQCANGKDDDMNGSMDYPDDPGCTSASDTDEYTDNPVACGNNVHINKLPIDGHVPMGMLGSTASALSGMCGGPGAEDVYELRIQHPKVVVASTDMGSTTADTVLYIRGAACTDQASELACNDDVSTSDHNSTVTASIVTPGTYYLVVDTKSSTGGAYDLHVQFLVGEGDPCSTGDDCGPGLVCRVPLNGSMKVCAKHVCQDGVDDDGDGKNDYPDDPGCLAATDDDETDDCPSGAMCPECGDGRDNDMDGHTDFPADTQCLAASSTSEACPTHELVPQLTTPATMGDTTGATSDFEPSCAISTGLPDLTYRLDVPALTQLSVTADTGGTWYPELELLNSTCGGTPLQCSTSITQAGLAAGAYYINVDGDYTGDQGPFTLNISGKIANHASCESALAQSGALTCSTGYSCQGTMGSRTCEPGQCSDGIDNDHDGKTDYPFDPGCADPGDNDETNPATAPVCGNGADDDTDGTTDFPNDYGCSSAAGTSEAFCATETDPTAKIVAKTTTGTTTGKGADEVPTTCSTSSTASDVVYALQLPVPVLTLQIDTLGSQYDTVLYMKDTQCGTELSCNDDEPGGSLQSELSLTNLTAGGYAIIVDGFSSSNGAFTLNVHGTVAAGIDCSSPLFSGTAPVLSCPTSCNATTHKCQ